MDETHHTEITKLHHLEQEVIFKFLPPAKAIMMGFVQLIL